MNTNVTDAEISATTASSTSVNAGASTRIRRNLIIWTFAVLSAACAGVLRFFGRNNPIFLRRMLREIWVEHGRLHREWSSAHRANSILLKEKELLRTEIQTLRSQLMQLRVENSDPGNLGRVGWQVSAWIPQAVLDKIQPGEKDGFVNLVANVLVDSALRGIFRRNAAGNCTALVWEPLGADSRKTVLTGWFEGDPRKPGVIYNSNDESAIRRIVGGDLVDEAAEQHRKHFLTAPATVAQLQPAQEEIDKRADRAAERERARLDIAKRAPVNRG